MAKPQALQPKVICRPLDLDKYIQRNNMAVDNNEGPIPPMTVVNYLGEYLPGIPMWDDNKGYIQRLLQR